MKKICKIVLKTVLWLLGIVLAAAIGLIAWLTITEYKPEAVEQLTLVQNENKNPLPAANETAEGTTVSVLTMNIGYCALGKDSDFFMDGGTQTRPDTKEVIYNNLEGITQLLADYQTDFILLQEVDTDSMRSYGVDQKEQLLNDTGLTAAYAKNYSCDFVPFPLPPIGKVHSGLLTLGNYEITTAERMSLYCPFSWPVRAANLKRCLLVSHCPIEGTDKELVLINLHLEAYDDGEGKAEQTKQLLNVLEEEYEKGNYVIAGGDFNQLFPECETYYPNTHAELWTPGILKPEDIPAGWQYAYDPQTPTCRLLNQPYDPTDSANTQYYVIDGFIVSPNISIEQVTTIKQDFLYSDHNPVLLSVILK